jgi:hypothetical protein
MKYEELGSVETINFLYRLQWSIKSREVSKQLTFLSATMKYEELDSVETINFLYQLQWSMKSRAVSKQWTFCIGYNEV